MDEDNGAIMVQGENVHMPQNSMISNFGNVNQGTVAIEASRAIAEAQGKLVIAKRFPRDEIDAYAKVAQACQRPGIADKAFFAYPRGGSTVSGPTIRFAEELARCWGNVEYGIKELSQDDGRSEMQAYAWDLETNSMSMQNFTNPHIREEKGKSKLLTSQRDIYENNANMGARRLRSRILAILPTDLVDMAMAECKKYDARLPQSAPINRKDRQATGFEIGGDGISAVRLTPASPRPCQIMPNAAPKITRVMQ